MVLFVVAEITFADNVLSPLNSWSLLNLIFISTEELNAGMVTTTLPLESTDNG